MKQTMLGIAALSMFVLSACKKDKDQPAPTKENLAGTYTFGSVTAKTGSGSEQDVTAQFYAACKKDDRLNLRSDGTLLYADAGYSCTPPDDHTGTWSVNGNQITIEGETSTIKSFNERTLVLGSTDTLFGNPVSYSVTLNKN